MVKKILFAILVLCSISSTAICQDGVTVLLSGRTQMNFGIDFALVNIDSKIIYYSQRISLFHQKHSIIENLPLGTYRLFLFSWSMALETTKNPIHDYFGFLEFNENKVYFLGNFVGKFSEEYLYYILEDSTIPRRVTKALINKSLINSELNIIKTYPYRADTLFIESKFLH